MTWNALLLLFLFRFSSISLDCYPIRVVLVSFLSFLIFLLISLYFSSPPGLFFPFFNTLLLSHMSSSSVGFLIMTVFADDQNGCIRHCIVEVVDQCLYTGVFSCRMVTGAISHQSLLGMLL